MKIWVYVLLGVFSIYNLNAQKRELSLTPGGGDTFFLGPGGKPDKVFNYGAYVQYYFKSDKVSFGVESGCVILRQIIMYSPWQIAAATNKESSFSNEPVVPILISTRIRSDSGWFLEAGLGTYFSQDVSFDLAYKLGAGYSHTLNEHFSIPLLVRLDFFQDRKNYGQFWDGVVNISFNVGIAYHFEPFLY